MMMRTVRIQLAMTTLVLICIGIVMIYSSSAIFALERYKDSSFFLKRHLIFVVLGFLATFMVMSIDYKRLRVFSKPLLITALILLILVLIPGIGKEVAGARRWFRYKFISFQPSEFAGLALVIYLADFISRKEADIRSLTRALMPVLLVLGAICLLLLAQPDLGTTISLATVVFVMLFVAGVDGRYLLGLLTTAAVFFWLLIIKEPYRMRRMTAFLNPWLDPQGSGFQIIQSQIALGSGGILGVGLGQSKQKLFYLPAAHTDFIFSIIGEELGLLGAIAVILLFIIFIRLGIKIIKYSHDRFGFFLALGLLTLLTFKSVVNLGVSCGVFPTKGLPLPFISYGGSSFIFDMISVGLLLNIARVGDSA
ncbi:MAG: putative lipid II flippase FtsW [Candidatus Omnitrophica bacterium]|nr:putative lipid II flippase FtsW [Candidatus Omnitrophota bacterium]